MPRYDVYEPFLWPVANLVLLKFAVVILKVILRPDLAGAGF